MGCISYLEFIQFLQDWCEKLGCYAEEYCDGVYVLKPEWIPIYQKVK